MPAHTLMEKLKRFNWRAVVAASVAGLIGFLIYEPNFVQNLQYDIKDSIYANDAVVMMDAVAVEGMIRKYLDHESHIISKNRDKFQLWDYFDLTDVLDAAREKSADVEFKWQDMITLRMKLWVDKQQATNDMRHNIEKDKCVTIDVLRKLKLPHPTVRFMWRKNEYSEAKLAEYLSTADYPAILKVGHIHQQKSTLFLPDKSAIVGKIDEYAKWTTDKMETHFVDNNPRWKDSTNILYAALEPCMFIQDVVNPGDFRAGMSARPMELMVEVLWGEAIHGVLTATVRGELALGSGQYKNTEEFIVLKNGWVAYMWPKTTWSGNPMLNRRSAVQAHRLNNGISWFKAEPEVTFDRVQLSAKEACSPLMPTARPICESEYFEIRQMFLKKYSIIMGALPTVWSLCGKFATGVGADYMRCDVFITPDMKVSVNEISLSSNWGNALSTHWQKKVIDLWVDGYKKSNNCTTNSTTCGSAYSGIFKGDLPSPVWHE